MSCLMWSCAILQPVFYLSETYNEEKQEENEKFEEAKRQLKTQKLDQMIETGEAQEIKVRDYSSCRWPLTRCY